MMDSATSIIDAEREFHANYQLQRPARPANSRQSCYRRKYPLPDHHAGHRRPFTVAVNIESTDGSEVLYAIVDNFQPPDSAGLLALSSGLHGLPSTPDGLALDFVREEVNGNQ